LIPNDFSQSGDEGYNFYKPFHFPIRYDPFVRGAIYSIVDIFGTPLTEGQIVHFEKTYCQPLSDMNIPDSEGKNLYQYLNFNSNIGWIHTPCSEKYLPFKKGKNGVLVYKNALRKVRCIEPFNKIVFFQLSQNGIYSKHIYHGSLPRWGTNI